MASSGIPALNGGCHWQIRTLCLSPDGGLLLAIDVDGRSLLINKLRRVLLHHFSFKGPVSVARFSPDGQYIACGVGKVLQVQLSLPPAHILVSMRHKASSVRPVHRRNGKAMPNTLFPLTYSFSRDLC